jgi:mono/diheme cytochrome c family protein
MMFIIGIVGVWPGEKLRETMRKPWVAGQYMYSNQIVGKDVDGKGIKDETPILAKKGLLKVNPWIPDRLRTITPENKLEVGKLLVRISCSNCHSLENTGKYRPLMPLAGPMGEVGLKAYMKGVIGTGSSPYMPKIALPDNEYDAMAAWIASEYNNKGATK